MNLTGQMAFLGPCCFDKHACRFTHDEQFRPCESACICCVASWPSLPA